MIEYLDGTHETISYKTRNGIKLYNNKNTSSYPIHWHTGIEIIYPVQGAYVVSIRNTNISLNEGDILIIPSGELHTLYAPESGGSRLILQIDYPQLSAQKEMRSLITLLKPCYVIRRQEQPDLSAVLGGYLSLIQQEYEKAANFYETYVFSLVEQFFVAVGRHYLYINAQNSNADTTSVSPLNNHMLPANASQPLEHESMNLFLTVCNYINSHFQDNPSLDDISEITGYSKSHFCRFFKLYAGKSFYDYLLDVKISHADTLLHITDQSITEIAMNSGFNSVSTFNRVFHQFHNCAPTQYRNFQVTDNFK